MLNSRVHIPLLVIILSIHKTIPIATNEQTGIENTLNYVNQLQQRIENSIDLLNNQIPQISSNLYNNIQDIASRSNIPTIISSLQNQITDSSECSARANNQIRSVSYSSKADISQCVEDAISKTGDLAAQTGILLHKANGVKNEITGRVGRCVKSNIGNEVTLALCLIGQVYPLQESLAALETEIEATLGVGQQTAQNILAGMAQCLVQMENIVTDKSNNIVKDYQDCVNLQQTNRK